MSYMFAYTTFFNQPLNAWDVRNVMEMKNMLKDSKGFNQSLGTWNLSNNVLMDHLFANTKVYI